MLLLDKVIRLMKKSKESINFHLFIIFSTFVVMVLSLSYIQASATILETAKNKTDISTYLISSREDTSYRGVQGPGYGNYNFSNIADLFSSCPEEIAIFVHGWNATELQLWNS